MQIQQVIPVAMQIYGSCRVRFRRGVAVLDISELANLEEKPLPLFFTPLADDQKELSARLIEVMRSDNIKVSEESMGRVQGNSRDGRASRPRG
jgi:hypothetical protein